MVEDRINKQEVTPAFPSPPPHFLHTTYRELDSKKTATWLCKANEQNYTSEAELRARRPRRGNLNSRCFKCAGARRWHRLRWLPVQRRGIKLTRQRWHIGTAARPRSTSVKARTHAWKSEPCHANAAAVQTPSACGRPPPSHCCSRCCNRVHSAKYFIGLAPSPKKSLDIISIRC